MLPAVTPVNGSGSPRIAIIGAGFSGNAYYFQGICAITSISIKEVFGI